MAEGARVRERERLRERERERERERGRGRVRCMHVLWSLLALSGDSKLLNEGSETVSSFFIRKIFIQHQSTYLSLYSILNTYNYFYIFVYDLCVIFLIILFDNDYEVTVRVQLYLIRTLRFCLFCKMFPLIFLLSLHLKWACYYKILGKYFWHVNPHTKYLTKLSVRIISFNYFNC